MRVTGVVDHQTFQSKNSEKSRHYRRFMDKRLRCGKIALPATASSRLPRC
jgi:hypothetical protein